MFLFKKIFSKFLFPMPLMLSLALIGLYLLWFTKKQKLGKAFVSVSVFVILILSYSAIPDALLAPLERKHKAYDAYMASNSLSKNTTAGIKQSIKYVVVLGGGNTSDPALPITGQIGKSALIRLIEAIRIYRKNEGSKLLLCGANPNDPVDNATIMAALAVELGVNKSDVITETESLDTKDQAIIIKKIVANDAFVLVTSASHMPRAMLMLKNFGMQPIPAPTEHNIAEAQGAKGAGYFFPNASNIHNAEIAIHEYLGIAWAMLRGQI